MKSEFYTFFPSPPLNRWIQFIWVSRGKGDTTKSKVLPNGAIELIINFGDQQKTLNKQTLQIENYYKHFWIAGLQNEPIIIQSETDTNLVGIRFCPGGAYPFFKFPIIELSDKVLEADWLKTELGDLRDEISDYSDLNRVVYVVQKYLFKKLDEKFLLNPAVSFFIDKISVSSEESHINGFINKTGYTHKHFIALFKKQVGTTPKNLQRIIRFQKIIQSIKNNPGSNWVDLLYEFSWCDPSHFVNDFKKLSGILPEQYLALKTFDENHCLLL